MAAADFGEEFRQPGGLLARVFELFGGRGRGEFIGVVVVREGRTIRRFSRRCMRSSFGIEPVLEMDSNRRWKTA
jgi:hypothetical protein